MTENLELFPPPAPDGRAQAAIEIVALRQQLNTWAHEYYVLDAPECPTPSTTACSRNCRRWRPRTPNCITPDSPTQRVLGAVLEGLASVRHAVPMLSIRTETDTEASGAQAFDARVRRELGWPRVTRPSNTWPS
jgi:DNA ligase (NAD+)